LEKEINKDIGLKSEISNLLRFLNSGFTIENLIWLERYLRKEIYYIYMLREN